MQQWLEALAADNPPREVLGNNPLRLDESDDVWFVRSGAWTSSPCRRRKTDGPAPADTCCRRGWRRPVRRGQGRHGARRPAGGRQSGHPDPPGCAVHSSRCAAPGNGGIAALVDAWLSGLTAGVRTAAPKQAVFLEPGREAQLPPGGAAGAARGACGFTASKVRRCSWPRRTAADGRRRAFPAGRPRLAGGRAAGARVAASTTETVLDDGQLWDALARFHRSLLSCMAANAADAETAERDRMAPRGGRKALTRATLRNSPASPATGPARVRRPTTKTHCSPLAGWWAVG